MAVRGSNSLFFASGIDNSGLKKGTREATGLVDKMGKDIEKADPYKPLDEGFDTDGVDKGAKETVGIIDQLKGKLKGINPFAVLAAGAAAAFTKIANDSYRMMQEFELSMKAVETISAATQEDFEGMSKAVFEFSKISTDSPKELADAFYSIVGAGHDGAGGLKLLEVAARAALGGVTDTMTAADGLTTIINAFGLEASEAESVADSLFTTVKLGKTTFEELSRSFAQVAPLAASTGFSFQEVLAAVASLTKQGTPTAQAMTQIRAAIQATSKVLGDGAAEGMTLQNAFQAVSDQAGGSINKLTTMAGSTEAVGAILALTGKNAQGARQDLEDLGNSAGASGVAFRTNAEANTNQWTIFGNRVSAVTKEIGSVILQMSNDVAGALNKTLESSEDVRKGFDAQKLELYKLEGALHNVTEGSEDYKAIRDEILRNYPEFLSGIDSETVTTQELLSVLNEVNDAYVQRFKFAQREAELREAYERQGMIEISIEDASDEFDEKIAEIRARTGIELDLSLNDEELYRQVKELTNDMVGFTGQRTEWQQRLYGSVGRLQVLNKQRKEYNEELKEQRQLIDEIAERNNRYSKADLQTEQGRLEAIRKINEASKESQLSQFVDSGVEEVEKALQARRDVLDSFRDIDATKSLEDLKSYLESENEEVAKYAQERQRMLNTSIRIGGGGTGSGGDSTFEDILKERENQYKEYTAAVNQLGKEQADEHFQNLLKQGKDYGDYLQRQLDQTTDAARRTAIAVAAENSKINLNRKGVSPVNELTSQGVVDFEINDTSINYIRGQIQRYTDELNAAKAADRPDIQERLDYWNQRLEAARAGLESEKALHANFVRTLSDMTMLELRQEKQKWKEIVNTAKAGTKEEREAKSMLGSVGLEIGNRTSDSIKEISNSLSDASAMFRKFGEEDLAKVLDQLSSVGSNIGTIVQGIATGGPLGALTAVGGMFGALGNLFGSSGGAPQRSELEKSIDGLERSVDRLRKSFSEIYGTEQAAARKQAEEDIKERIRLEKDALSWAVAVLDEFGSGVGNLEIPNIGFKGNGADLERWIEEKKAEIEDLRLQQRSLEEDNMEYFTGRTSDSITDSIIQGFRDGKRGIKDFADTFEELMQDALMQTFRNEFLAKQMAGFYDEFANLGEDGEYSPEDINRLQGMWAGIIEGSEEQMNIINGFLEDLGFNPFGADTKRQGLSGAISSITEDTANILAGTMNAIRLDVRQGVEVAITNSEHLSNIDRYTSYLPAIAKDISSMDGRLSTMERGMQEFNSEG